MIVYTETYTDFNGNPRTEEFRFHFSKAELMEMELAVEGGFSARVQRIIDANSRPELLKVMKTFILDAYGVKSEDGRRFKKSDEIRREFEECPVYSTIFMRLTTGPDAAKLAAEFINGVTPDDMPKTMAAAPAAT
jgi:hypothetical protein